MIWLLGQSVCVVTLGLLSRSIFLHQCLGHWFFPWISDPNEASAHPMATGSWMIPCFLCGLEIWKAFCYHQVGRIEFDLSLFLSWHNYQWFLMLTGVAFFMETRNSSKLHFVEFQDCVHSGFMLRNSSKWSRVPSSLSVFMKSLDTHPEAWSSILFFQSPTNGAFSCRLRPSKKPLRCHKSATRIPNPQPFLVLLSVIGVFMEIRLLNGALMSFSPHFVRYLRLFPACHFLPQTHMTGGVWADHIICFLQFQ